MTRTIRVAAAAWPIEWHDDWASFAAKAERWVAEAAGKGAQLLVIPEYALMELASLEGAAIAADANAQIAPVAARADAVAALFGDLARRHGCHILAGTMVEANGAGRYVNRARLHGPAGGMGIQDKNVLTMWERENFDIVAGDGRVTLFDIGIAKVGVLICYDCEFPNAARALVRAGAEVLLIPSCTEAMAGYWRVRIGAMARALEGQCYAVHAPTVGDAPWSGVVEGNSGTGGVYAPPDRGLPDDGVVAVGAMNVPGWTYADLDLDALAAARVAGAVRGFSHWGEQPGGAPLDSEKPDGGLTARLVEVF